MASLIDLLLNSYSSQPNQQAIQQHVDNSQQNIQQPLFDPVKYSKYTGDNDANLNPNYKPLNFDSLMSNGAFRVTHQGLDNGKYNPDPKVGFSLVSAYNDEIGKGSGTNLWKNNPEMYGVVRNMFANNPEYIGPHKYMQIVESARDMGIPENQIFAQPDKTKSALDPHDPNYLEDIHNQLANQQ